MVGNGCVSGDESGRLDALFYFFTYFFRVCVLFLPMNERVVK